MAAYANWLPKLASPLPAQLPTLLGNGSYAPQLQS